MIAGQDGEVFDFVATGAAAVGAVIANKGTVAEQKKVRIGVEESAASIAAETVDMPSVARCGDVRKGSRPWTVGKCT